MTQEQKDLLLKDLCARLPYKVKVQDTYYNSLEPATIWLLDLNAQKVRLFADEGYQSIECIKPYLFPLSSMNEEQWMDTPYANLNKFTFDSFKCGCSTLAFETYEVNLNYVVEFINWCYKNHFDINGLIPKGLAEDATGKNIY
jgi:hypothetical protein